MQNIGWKTMDKKVKVKNYAYMDHKRKIYFYRTEKGITQEEFAKICGVNYTTISRFLNGKANPTKKTLEKIFKVIDGDK